MTVLTRPPGRFPGPPACWDEQELAERWALTHDEFELLRNRTERSRLGCTCGLFLAGTGAELLEDAQPAIAVGAVYPRRVVLLVDTPEVVRITAISRHEFR